MHNAPSPCAHCAQAARWAPCRGAQGAVSQAMPCRVVVVSLRARARWHAVSQCCCLRPQSRYKNCIATLAPAAGRVARLLRRIVAHARSYCSVVARHVAACLAIHPTTRPPTCHDTPICIATQPQRPGLPPVTIQTIVS